MLGDRQALAVAARVEQRPGVPDVQAGQPARRQQLGVAQHLLADGERLPVRAAVRRLPSDLRPVPDDHLRVARFHGVVHHPGQVGIGLGQEEGEHQPVQRDPPGSGQARLDGPAGEVVPEHHVAALELDDAELLGGDQARRAAGQRLHQRPRGRGDDHRELLDPCPGRRVELHHPGQHRVGHRRRHGLARVGQHLGEEERVARGGRQRRRAVHPGLLGERAHGPGRQPGEREAAHVPPDQRTQQPSQRVIPGHLVVAEGQHDDGGQVGDAAPEQAHEVQRGVVGPMHVLDDQHRGPARTAQLGEHRLEHGVPVGACRDRRRQRPGRAPRRVLQRAERTRRDQVVAGAAQHPGACGQRRERGADQGASCRCLPRRTPAPRRPARPRPRRRAAPGRRARPRARAAP